VTVAGNLAKLEHVYSTEPDHPKYHPARLIWEAGRHAVALATLGMVRPNSVAPPQRMEWPIFQARLFSNEPATNLKPSVGEIKNAQQADASRNS
jgi:hypothetical protein